MGERTGDDGADHSQTERFYESNSKWYFKTREGEDQGPFMSRKEAESGLAAYVRHKLETGQFKF